MASTTFSMRMDADMKRRLEETGRLRERSAAYIVNEALAEFYQRQDAIAQAVREAIEDDDGTRYSEEVVMNWMERWADGHDDPFPEPDIFEDVAKSAKSA